MKGSNILRTFPEGKIFFVTSTLPYKFGGRTKSLLRRAKLLTEGTENKLILATTNYNENYDQVYASYRKKNLVNENIQFINMYDDLKGTNSSSTKIKKHRIEERRYIHVKEDNREGYRYFDKKTGQYVMFKSFETKNNQLKFIDYFKQGIPHRSMREHYDSKGLLHKKTFYHDTILEPYEEVFYNNKGQFYLNKLYTLNGNKSKLKQIFYYDRNMNRTHMFKTEKELFTFWFNQVCDDKTYMVVDARLLDRPVLNIKNINVKKIFQLHNNHLSTPNDIHSNIKNSYKTLINRSKEADAIICLTNEQANDIERLTGNKENIKVIPHSINPKKISIDRDIKKIVVVSRLHPQKRLNHIIQAFSIFIKKHPDYTLEIYGMGEEEDKLKQLISDLNLSDTCILKGFTDKPDYVFQSGGFSVVSSEFEGFCLSILESLSNGCPVVSYDVKYGPKDLIKDGINGYLAQDGDIEDLSMKMEMMAHSDLMKISNECISSVKSYNDETFINKWIKLLNEV
ncbi:glycosyltransferase [Terrilactibacillus sp. BCM23-1]|uniref:Glycosyltransferase n=1 Tax=Terrilactibacillus tamarindi TaxID=2599694 RepID=A0A6N8CND9_9BACI|nr:glycosyltransferase [Terrilactibacillus tamarindi]MTT30613.1 glycosyltransferase [Terrilactibacillus tamarindi]